MEALFVWRGEGRTEFVVVLGLGTQKTRAAPRVREMCVYVALLGSLVIFTSHDGNDLYTT